VCVRVRLCVFRLPGSGCWPAARRCARVPSMRRWLGGYLQVSGISVTRRALAQPAGKDRASLRRRRARALGVARASGGAAAREWVEWSCGRRAAHASGAARHAGCPAAPAPQHASTAAPSCTRANARLNQPNSRSAPRHPPWNALRQRKRGGAGEPSAAGPAARSGSGPMQRSAQGQARARLGAARCSPAPVSRRGSVLSGRPTLAARAAAW
jgi:hypothetical protein